MNSSVLAPEPTTGPGIPEAAAPEPLRAVFSEGLPELLRELGISLLVTTYQAGKLVIVREQDGAVNTHFRNFLRPMGLALSPSATRMAVGSAIQVWEFQDVPEVAEKVEPKDKHDACFLPRSSHMTGDVQVHEMAYGCGSELWFVNTRSPAWRRSTRRRASPRSGGRGSSPSSSRRTGVT